MARPGDALNINDLRDAARRRLPVGLFTYLDRGAEDEISMRDNRSVFESIRFRPKVCVDVSTRTSGRIVLGQSVASPIAVGPTGLTSLLWHDGETLMARAAAAAGLPYTVGIFSMTSIESLAAIPDLKLWAQTYMMADTGLTDHFIARAKDAGCQVLMITADMATPANREHAARSRFSPPLKISPTTLAQIAVRPAWLTSTPLRYALTNAMPRYANLPPDRGGPVMAASTYRDMLISASLDWDAIARIRRAWPHKLVLKGISHPDDAGQAIAHGLDGVVVSNHGGRALDGSLASLAALPDVIAAANGELEVLVDGGFRRGSDVVKALALGASSVLLGRAPLYGVSAYGRSGASRALEIFTTEIDRVLGLLGCRSLDDLGPDCLDLTRWAYARS